MNIRPSAGTAIASLSLLLAVTSSVATNANPIPTRTAPVTRVYGTVARQAMTRRRYTAGGCSTSNAQYAFVGLASGASDIAGGEYAAVPGGNFNQACDENSGIGSGYDNIIGGNDGNGAQYSFVGGGSVNAITGEAGFIGAGESNDATAREAGVVSGNDNLASGNASMVGSGTNSTASGVDSFVGSGAANSVSGTASFVGSGFYGTVTGNGSFIGAGGSLCNCMATINLVSGADSFLGSGDNNSVSGTESFLGGGNKNMLAANEAVLGGGYGNGISSGGGFSVVAGGNANSSTGEYEFVGGGYDNAAKGADAVIPGGNRNEAYGTLTFAAGYQAHALYNGSFVWSDYNSSGSPIADTGVNQFVVRASGGTYIYSNEAATAGVSLAIGSGTWSSLSDRNAKTDIVPLDDASILAKVAALPVTSWRYKTESGVHHLGPMAQDFYAAFGVGEDDRHITSIDEDGVALAAIKALHRENGALHAQVATQHGEIAELRQQVERLQAEFAATHRQ